MSLFQQSPRAWQTLRNKTVLWRGLAVVVVLVGVAGVLVTVRVMASHADVSPIDSNAYVPVKPPRQWDPCSGEMVDLTGNMHVVSHVTPDGTGGFEVDQHFSADGVTGVGETTGATYQLVGQSQFEGYLTAHGVFTHVPAKATEHLISQSPDGTGSNMMIHVSTDATVNPDGTVTMSSVDFADVSCL